MLGILFHESETQIRDRIVEIVRSLYARGLSPGESGNIGVRLGDGWLLRVGRLPLIPYFII